jgi:hypothetical protein
MHVVCARIYLGRIQGISEGGAEGAICPGPPVQGGPSNLENKIKIGTFFEIIIGLRKNFLNLYFAQCINLTRICREKFFDP